jgi:hypothetical protein
MIPKKLAGFWKSSDHHDSGADFYALIKIRDVIVAHADAAGRHVRADGPRLV